MELRPLDPVHVPALVAIHATPEVREWWGQMSEGFPLTDEPTATRFTIFDEGEIVGMVQYGEETEPEYRHAWIDIFIGPEHTGRGIGPAALRAVMEILVSERGHHRITIDPALENERAIRAYQKAGFERAGVHRKAWRDPDGVWRDVQFMEFIAPSA